MSNYPGQLSCNYPEDEVVEQLFQHIHFLRWLGKSPRKVITAENVCYWQHLTGTTVDLSGFKTLFEQLSLENDTKAGLYDGFTEAITFKVSGRPLLAGPIDRRVRPMHREMRARRC